VEGRVLPPPTIAYNGATAKVGNGKWDNRNHEFIQPAPAPIKWAIVNSDIRINKEDIQKFERMISSLARKNRMNLQYAGVGNFDWANNPLAQLLTRMKAGGVQFVFVIFDEKHRRPRVRQAAEIQVKILAECILGVTIKDKCTPPTIGNILLKMNAKLNGVNHGLIDQNFKKWSQDAMFVGADVNHPSPGETKPSVVGVVSSFDSTDFRYNADIRLQKPRLEMIDNFKEIMLGQIRFYQQKMKKFPQKIFYFRDGVSESQLQAVLDWELSEMKQACAELQIFPVPKITVAIVQKRHHTRFFPDKRDGDGSRNNNVLAGTVVDKDIVHPFQFQFYMASHAAIQGVTKPAKYCVIFDGELNFLIPFITS
jgi:eukaryotic translation initiation factor 2C